MKSGVSYNTGYYGTDPDALIASAGHAEAPPEQPSSWWRMWVPWCR